MKTKKNINRKHGVLFLLTLLFVLLQPQSVKAETYTDEAVFYISDENRTTTYKYTISGFGGKENHNYFPEKQLDTDKLTWKVERITSGAVTFLPPQITNMKLYPSSIQAHLTRWYLPEQEPYDEVHLEFNTESLDNGVMYYGISIEFDNFNLVKRGYEVKEENIDAFVLGTNQKAYGYNHYYTRDNEYTFTSAKEDCLQLSLVEVGSFKELYYPVSADVYTYGNKFTHYDNLGYVSSDSSFSSADGTMTLNCPLMYFGGLKWRRVAGNNMATNDTIGIESDQPEYVFHSTPKSYTVIANANGGIINDYISGRPNVTEAKIPVTYDAGYYDNIGGLSPAKEGSEFLGWYTTPNGARDGGIMVWDKDGRANNNNVHWGNGKWCYDFDGTFTVYAVWEDTHTVKYDGNGATSGYMGYADSISADSNYTIRANIYQKTGYRALGYHLIRQSDGKIYCNDGTWQSNPSESQKKIFDASKANSIYFSKNFINGSKMGGDTFVFKVVWGIGECVVHYDGNGATSGTMGDSSMTYHESFMVRENAYTRAGYKFVGWNTKPDGSGISYSPDQWVLITKDGTLNKTDGQPLENAHYQIVSQLGDNYLLDVEGGSTDWGGNIEIWDRLENNGQRFKFIYQGDGTYEIVNINSDLAIEVASGSTENGANIRQWERNNASCQRWIIVSDGDGYYHIRNQATGKYMDVYGGMGYAGANVLQWEYNNNASEKWKFEKVDDLITDGTTLYAQWEPDTRYYTMTVRHHKWVVDGSYSAGGYWQHFTTTTDTNVLGGSTYTPAYSKTPAGYYNYSREWDGGWVVTGDKTFQVYYYPYIRSLTVEPNGGIWNHSAAAQTFRMVMGEVKTIANPTREGYTFKGWKISSTGGILNGSTFTMGTADEKLTALWEINYYNVNLVAGYGIESVTGGGSFPYNTEITISAKVLQGYHWLNWSGTLGSIGEQTYTFRVPAQNVTMTASGDANTYTLQFRSNEGGTVTPIADMTVKYDETLTLPDGAAYYRKYTLDGVNVTNEVLSGDASFEPESDVYPSVFKGWSLESDKDSFTPQWEADRAMDMAVIAAGAGVVSQNNAAITLYAIWDDCPWVEAENLYYTLKEAQEGLITHDELISHAKAFDRENDNYIAPGINNEDGTSFYIWDYSPEDFTQFTHAGAVTETYRAVDGIGNEYKKMITVYIVDTDSEYKKPDGTTRFIDEKYYNESYEMGGLEDNSVWKTDSEYEAVIKSAFENSKNDTSVLSFRFSYETIQEMKKFVEENGIGNSRSEDNLQEFYDWFMAPNIGE